MSDRRRDEGAVTVEYGLVVAAVGALLIAVLLVLGDQLVEVYNLLVDKTLAERVDTTINAVVLP
ncbi:MAG: hypothetical protein R3249_04815 [Nitriliruptorales bacterium]|nr:hypothetical protein [Nitriliruptorales bacterium]